MSQGIEGSARTAPRPLRFRLFLLAASGLAPLALFLLLAAAYVAESRREETQRSAIEYSRALATAIDADLRSTITLLNNFAATSQMQDLDPAQLQGPGFAPFAQRMTQGLGWMQIVVADAQGRIVLRSREGATPSLQPVEGASLAQAIATRQPVVGRLARGPQGRDAFAVRVPVMRGNELRYVLTAVLPSSLVLDLLERQQVDSNWVVGVFDQEGFRVARSRANASPRYSPTLEALVKARGQEGGGSTRTLEGVESLTGFTRVRSSQWVVAVGIPAAEAHADLWRLLAALAAGMAASLGLLAWFAWRASRYITAPIDELKRAARDLGAGRRVDVPRLGVQELDDVAGAMKKAAADIGDANERKRRVEAEREELLTRVEDALHAAEQANRNKDEFLALLGHELRNPLSPITNALHLMDLKGDPATARERGVIHRQLNYVTRLVDDLLDAARINSNRLVMNLQPLQPVRVIEQTVEAVRANLGGRRLVIAISPEARALWVRADEARLVQILNNLLGNAIKFTREDGTIEIAARAASGRIVIAVKDDGAGMPPAELARAFEVFYQAPSGQRGVNGGLGLGLAIVKSLVEMHAGEVRAESAGPNLGLTVTFELPVIEGVQAPAHAPGRRASGDSLRVLVVDDNEDAGQTLATLLEVSGYEVRAVFTPEAALDVFPAFAPQLAILDIGLPRMDGYELVGRLKAMCGGRPCRFIALTGYGQESDVQRALAAGFDAHLTKPADPDVLLGLLGDLAKARA